MQHCLKCWQKIRETELTFTGELEFVHLGCECAAAAGKAGAVLAELEAFPCDLEIKMQM